MQALDLSPSNELKLVERFCFLLCPSFDFFLAIFKPGASKDPTTSEIQLSDMRGSSIELLQILQEKVK